MSSSSSHHTRPGYTLKVVLVSPETTPTIHSTFSMLSIFSSIHTRSPISFSSSQHSRNNAGDVKLGLSSSPFSQLVIFSHFLAQCTTGSAVTFRSIDDVAAPISLSPAAVPPTKSKGMKCLDQLQLQYGCSYSFKICPSIVTLNVERKTCFFFSFSPPLIVYSFFSLSTAHFSFFLPAFG